MEEDNSTYLVSIDVGIKNLAICVFKNNGGYEIKDWVVLNIGTSDMDQSTTISQVPCSMCKKIAKYRHSNCVENMVFCTKHAKDHTMYILPKGELSVSKIKKSKLADLKRLIEPFYVNTTNSKPKTKLDWTTFYDSIILHPIECSSPITTASASEISLIDVSRILTQKLNSLFSGYMMHIQKVLIENQISPIATRMKSVQSMVTQYFVMTCPTADIQYVSSTHKLDGLTTDSYSQRKKLGILKCKEYLLNDPVWLNYLISNKKQDDLSDCFLQGQWYINK